MDCDLYCTLRVMLEQNIINTDNLKKFVLEIERCFKNNLMSNESLLEIFSLIRDYSEDWLICTRIAECYYRKKNFHKALSLFKYVADKYKSINLNNIYFRMFDIYMCIKDYDKASSVLDKCVINTELEKANHLKYTTLLSSVRNDLSLIEFVQDASPMIKIETCKVRDKNFKLSNYDLVFNSFELNEEVVFHLYYNNNILPFNNEPVTISAKKIVNVDNTGKNSSSQKYVLNINLLLFSRVSIFFKSTNQEVPFFSLKCTSILKVLRGRDNWLFLDNDSNNSVSQFKGEVLISNDELEMWRQFLIKTKLINNSVLLIPPSKESVFSQYYPFNRANITPIDQLFSLFNELNTMYLYPADMLRSQVNSYSKTETHWSYRAAMHVSNMVIQSFIPNNVLDISFFSFENKKWYGDLGSKVSPSEYSCYECLSDSIVESCRSKLVFTNYLPTQGLIEKYHNDNSVLDKRLIVFGDSFSTSMLPYFITVFKSVILVRSNASLIQEMIDFEKPDFVLFEITERFILKAPRIFEHISDYPPCVRTDIVDKDFVKKISLVNAKDIYQRYLSKYIEVIKDLSS